MPTLETENGKQVAIDAAEVTAQFEAAMNDDTPDTQAPPRRQRRADPAAEDAPKPRRGRPPKEEKSRTTTAAAAPVKDDYTADAQSAVGTLWSVAAAVPFTQPYALVIEGNADALVSALAEGAKHNATIRRWVDTGKNTWMLQLASVGMSMGMQALQLARDPEMRAKAAAKTRENLKAQLVSQGIQVEEPAAA